MASSRRCGATPVADAGPLQSQDHLRLLVLLLLLADLDPSLFDPVCFFLLLICCLLIGFVLRPKAGSWSCLQWWSWDVGDGGGGERRAAGHKVEAVNYSTAERRQI